MSATGRPEREYRSAQREGPAASATGRPEREYRSAQREGPAASATGRTGRECFTLSARGGPNAGPECVGYNRAAFNRRTIAGCPRACSSVG